MDRHQRDTQRPFCLSQPELDTSGTFDIPAPLPVASDLSHSTFWVWSNTQSDPQNHLTISCDKEILRGPAASVLELKLDGSAEDMEKVPVQETALLGGTQMAPHGSGLPSKPARVRLDTLDHTESTPVHQNLSESSSTASSHQDPDGPKLLLMDHKSNKTSSEPAATPLRSAACQKLPVPLTETPGPETVGQIWAVSRDQGLHPVSLDSSADLRSSSQELCPPN